MANPAICQTKGNSEHDAQDISNPVIEVGTAIESQLYEFNQSAKGACSNEDKQQADKAGARQGKGQESKSSKVYELVAPLGCWGWLVHWPEHRDSEDYRYDTCERYPSV